MKHHSRISLPLAALGLATLVSFQNCSNVSFDATPNAKGENDLIQIDYPDSQSLPDVVDEPGSEQEPTSPPTTQQPPTASPTPLPELPKDPDVETAYAYCDGLPTAPALVSNSTQNALLQDIRDDRAISDKNDVRVVNMRGNLTIEKSNRAEIENVRGAAAISAGEVSVVNYRYERDGDGMLIDTNKLMKFENTRSPLCVRAAAFESMVNLRSEEPIVFIGRTVNGKKPQLDRLENLRGVVIIRGVDVKSLVNFRGVKLVLENSVVGHLENVRTDIYMKDSIIGSEVNVQGKRSAY